MQVVYLAGDPCVRPRRVRCWTRFGGESAASIFHNHISFVTSPNHWCACVQLYVCSVLVGQRFSCGLAHKQHEDTNAIHHPDVVQSETLPSWTTPISSTMSSSPVADAVQSSALRRSSGRVASKRKRDDVRDDNGDRQMPEDYVSDEARTSEEDEPDEEEVREQSKKVRNAKIKTARRPVQKKLKANGTSLPIRNGTASAKRKVAKKSKAVLNSGEAEEVGGLYAEVFASGERFEKTAADWLRGFKQHESQALADLIDFVLQCAGCSSRVETHDIEDPDGVTNRLTDIQDEFQATAPTDYPLIAKGKAGNDFRKAFTGFLDALVKSIAADGIFYSDPILMENIEVWFSTMSSAGNRAFRHTATIASLSVMSSLAELAAERQKVAAATQLQTQTERNKPKVNKARVKEMEEKATDAAQAQEYVEVHLKDWFDTVFIHRYRDVDPAIRKDCMTALGDWIMILPDVYFDGQHLRYLGWVLSDTVASTRAEVIHQLHRLYKEKDKIGGLKTFTERFRQRIVEIATTDAETSVRAAGIDLLDLLRENGLLEPDDVDAVGRLIYDSDARVRKTVARFFAENINELYNSKIDELGGLEALEEALPEVGDGNFETPSLEWLKFKSVAEMLVDYDSEDVLSDQVERNRDGSLTLHAGPKESRYTLAADALSNKIEEIKDWQALCGYLLFDHSTGRMNSATDDPVAQLKQECKLNDREEIVLLEIVAVSVKNIIVETAEKSTSTKKKITKKQQEALTEEQEEAARHLCGLIPKLLKRFGDVPGTAAGVLRIGNVLDLPQLQDIRQDAATYVALLDDIRKQFMSHGSDQVLGPASEAILHAKSYGELDDLTDEKLAGLWEDVVTNLTELVNVQTIGIRGSSTTEELEALSNNLLRVTRLAPVSSPVAALEDGSLAQIDEGSTEEYQGAIDYVISLVQRALPASGPALDARDSELEDEVAVRAAEAALRYLQWKIYLIIHTANASTSNDIPFEEVEAIARRRDLLVANLHNVLQSRKASDSVCVRMSIFMLELHSSAVVMGTIKVRPGMNDYWDALIQPLDIEYLKSIMKVFAASEKKFAHLAGKKLERATTDNVDGDLDAHSLADEPESEDESEDEEDGEKSRAQASQQRRQNQQNAAILAEKTLCELTGKIIMALHAGIVKDERVRVRLERNRTRLGANYKELLAYLDLGAKASKAVTKSKARAKGAPAAGTTNGVVKKGRVSAKSNAIVAEDEVEDEIEDVDVDDDPDEEDLRRRGLVVDGNDGEEEQQDREQIEGDQMAGAEVESVAGD